MLDILTRELDSINQEYQTVTNQKASLEQGLIHADQRLFQLQGAHERITKLIEEVKANATKDSGGQDRGVEASEIRDNQDVSADVRPNEGELQS